MPLLSSFEVEEGQLLEIQFSVFDADPVTMQLQTPVEGANFYVEANKAILMWTPDFNVVQHPQTEKTFTFAVSAKDIYGATANKEVNVRVIDVNRNPVLSVSPESIEELAGKTVELNVIVSDADNDRVTVTIDNPNFEVIDNKYVWKTKLSDARIDPYIVTFTASDDFGGAAHASSIIKLTSVEPENKVPVASFTYPTEAFIGEEVTFDASPSFDQDGEIVRYEWETGDGNTLFEKIVNHIYTIIGQFTIKLTVTDNKGATSTIEQIINIIARPGENQAPVANAGPDQIVKLGSTVVLDGSASFDPNGDEISYSWTQLSGKTVNLADPSTKFPVFLSGEIGDYTFGLIVMDNKGLQSTLDTVKITVIEEIPPEPPEVDITRDIHKFTISSVYVREQDNILEVYAKVRNRGNNQEDVEITATMLPTGESFSKKTRLGLKESSYEIFYLNKPENSDNVIIKLEVNNRKDSDVYYLPFVV